MTELLIQLGLNNLYKDEPFHIINSFLYKWEVDFWTMTHDGVTREYEIKISRGDFFNDAKKPKHLNMQSASPKDCAHYFYYVTPWELVKPSDVPKNYGLIYFKVTEAGIGYFNLVKKPRKLHKNPFSQWNMLAVKFFHRWQTLWLEKYKTKQITYGEYKKEQMLEFSAEELEIIDNNDNSNRAT